MNRLLPAVLLLGCLPLGASAPQAPPAVKQFDVKAYGAKGDGRTDDTQAIQAAIDAAAAAGGGNVHLPAGTFLLRKPHGDQGVLLYPKSNVSISGDGNASVLKVGDGLNARGTFQVLRQRDKDGQPPLQNASFSHFQIDCNGAQNLVTKARHTQSDICIGAEQGSNISIDHVTVVNNPGRQCFSFGNNTRPQKVHDLKITNCTFRNTGSSIPGNEAQNDHSAIYAQADGCVIQDNSFINDTRGLNTAIECHSSNAVVSGNTIVKYNQGFNVVATYTDQIHSIYKNNTVTGCARGFRIWTMPGMQMSDVTITGNTVDQEESTYPVLSLDLDVKGRIQGLTISDNTFSSSAPPSTATGPGIEIGDVHAITIKGNTFKNLLGRAVALGGISDGEPAIGIEGNTVIGCGRTTNPDPAYHAAFGLYSFKRLRELHVSGNKVSGMAIGLGGNAPVGKTDIHDNQFQGVQRGVKWDGPSKP